MMGRPIYTAKVAAVNRENEFQQNVREQEIKLKSAEEKRLGSIGP